MSGLDPTIEHLAAGQHGMLTTSQLLDCGISAPTLVTLVRRHVLRHPGRGLYALASLADPDPVGWHRQLCAGALLLYPDAVLASTSALLAHGVRVWGADLARPAIRRPPDRARGMSAFWVRHGDGDRVDTPWGPAEPVAVALASHAVDRGIEPGVVSADHALHDDMTTAEQLERAVDHVLGWQHGSRAGAMLRHADGRRESVGESRCALALALAGVDALPQVVIEDVDGAFVARVDFLVAGTRVVVEFDGKLKYAGGDPGVLWAEKRREDRLRRLGYLVVRITWADLETPGAVAAKVRAALAAA